MSDKQLVPSLLLCCVLRWPVLVPGEYSSLLAIRHVRRRGEAGWLSVCLSISLRRNITMSAATTAAHSGRAGEHQGQARDSFNMDMLEVSQSVYQGKIKLHSSNQINKSKINKELSGFHRVTCSLCNES